MCGGGTSEAPTKAEEDSVPGCSNDPYDWFFDEGLTCDWYAQDNNRCDEFGDQVGTLGLTAKKA